APLCDEGGRVVGAVAVIRDVTWSKRLEREREEARAHELALGELNRRKDEFLSVVSHELRTPLATLQGYIDLLARRFNVQRPQEGGPPTSRATSHWYGQRSPTPGPASICSHGWPMTSPTTPLSATVD